MGRISHHLKGKDYKKTHQRKLDEQRALYLERREKEIQQQQYIEEIKKLSDPLKVNWRNDINEGMTSSGVFFATLPATGDVNYPATAFNSESGPYGGIIDYYDSSLYDTILVDVSLSGNMAVGIWPTVDQSTDAYFVAFASGTYSFTVPQSKNLLLFTVPGSPEGEEPTGEAILLNHRFKRRTPLNVLVSLDSPEATNFVRTDPTMRGLSAEERKKKLEDMLDAGDELLSRLGVQGSKARPADTGNIQSWEIAQIQPAQQQKGATGVGVPDTKELPGPRPAMPGTMNYPPEWTKFKNA